MPTITISADNKMWLGGHRQGGTYNAAFSRVRALVPDLTQMGPVTGLSIFPLHVTILQGQTSQLSLTAHDADGTTVTIEDAQWISGSAAVAYVNKGLITGRTPGQTVIRARYAGLETAIAIIVGASLPVPPPPTPTTSVVPIDARLVYCSDFDSRRYATDAQLLTICEQSLLMEAQWWKRETGREPEFKLSVLKLPITLLELQTPPQGDPLPMQRDACGQGMHGTQLWNHFPIPSEVRADGSPWRRVALVADDAGGWAGGSHDWFSGNTSGPNWGHSAIGNWGMYARATGQPNPGCLCHYDAAFCSFKGPYTDWAGVTRERHWRWAGGHENAHAFNLDPHNPNIGLGDTLTAVQKQAFLAYNEAFLKGT